MENMQCRQQMTHEISPPQATPNLFFPFSAHFMLQREVKRGYFHAKEGGRLNSTTCGITETAK